MTLKTGKVVYLNSGGPALTVKGVEDRWGKVTVHCVWFSGGEYHSDVFPMESLTTEKRSPKVAIAG